MDEDEVKGSAKDVGGKIKDAAGGLTGDESLQAEGKTDQMAGKAQKLYGAAKDAIGHAMPDDDMIGTAEGAVEKFSEFVKAQPMLAVLGTAAAGYALAFLMHGSRRR